MFLLLSILWLIITAKYILFWVYLWQLKEYHIGRFIDHFRTEKGKTILFSKGRFLKLLLLVVMVFSSGNMLSLLATLLTIIYAAEVLLFVKNIFAKSIKKPVLTAKTALLVAINGAFAALFLAWGINLPKSAEWLAPLLMAFEILLPITVSAVVLITQPFAVAARTAKLKQATQKMDAILAAKK